eukprot:403350682
MRIYETDQFYVVQAIAIVQNQSRLLKNILQQQNFLNLVQESGFEIVIIGSTVYEYQLAQVFNVPYIQLVDNPFNFLQLFNDLLAPKNSLTCTFFSQFYPEIFTSFRYANRFINHISIIQQELFIKPLVSVAFNQGLQKYIPFLNNQEIANKVLINGPSFIEELKLQNNLRTGYFMTQQDSLQLGHNPESINKIYLVILGPRYYVQNQTLSALVRFAQETDYIIKFIIEDLKVYEQELIKELQEKNYLISRASLGNFKVQALISVPDKQAILMSIQNKIPLIGLTIEASQRIYCQLLEYELNQGICLTPSLPQFTDLSTLYYVFQYLNTNKKEIQQSIDLNFNQLKSQQKNQASLQFHIDQVIFDHLSERQLNENEGFFKSHDYDLLLILSIGCSINIIKCQSILFKLNFNFNLMSYKSETDQDQDIPESLNLFQECLLPQYNLQPFQTQPIKKDIQAQIKEQFKQQMVNEFTYETLAVNSMSPQKDIDQLKRNNQIFFNNEATNSNQNFLQLPQPIQSRQKSLQVQKDQQSSIQPIKIYQEKTPNNRQNLRQQQNLQIIEDINKTAITPNHKGQFFNLKSQLISDEYQNNKLSIQESPSERGFENINQLYQTCQAKLNTKNTEFNKNTKSPYLASLKTEEQDQDQDDKLSIHQLSTHKRSKSPSKKQSQSDANNFTLQDQLDYLKNELFKLFIIYSDFSSETGTIFLKQLTLHKLLKDANILNSNKKAFISLTDQSINLLIAQQSHQNISTSRQQSKKAITSISQTISFKQFQNLIISVLEKTDAYDFKSNPQQAIVQCMQNHFIDGLLYEKYNEGDQSIQEEIQQIGIEDEQSIVLWSSGVFNQIGAFLWFQESIQSNFEPKSKQKLTSLKSQQIANDQLNSETQLKQRSIKEYFNNY